MGTTNVLVVDDDKLTRWSVATTLARLGYEITEAATFGEGVAALQRHAPRLVLLDIRLPDGDGFVLLEQIRRRYPDIPVLMMTAHHSTETAKRSLTLGAAGHLSKPFKPADLTRAVASALEGVRPKESE